MRTIQLSPYPGQLILAKDADEFKRVFKKRTGGETHVPRNTDGRTQPLTHKKYATTYLVFARDRATLVHELSHVVLKVFKYVGIDPRKAGGEPFCYMIGHLLYEATKR